MLLENRPEPSRDRGEGLVPGRVFELSIPADERLAKSVRIVMQLAERGALRADEAPAEGILLITPDSNDPISLDLDCETTGRLAERTGPVMNSPLRTHSLDDGHGVNSSTPF